MIRRLLIAAVAAPLVILGIAVGSLYWFLTGDGSRRALEQQASAWLGQPVRIGRATLAFLPRLSLRLQDVRVGDPVRVTLSGIDLSTPIRPLLARRIEDATLVVADSRIELPLPFPLPLGERSPATAEANGSVQLVSVRSIGLRNVTLASRGREINLSAESALAGDRLTITTLNARSGQTSVDATGFVKLSPRVDASLDARADVVDGDELLALVDAFVSAPADTTSSSAPPRILAQISAPRGSIAGVAVRRIDATIRADGRQVSIEPLAFDILGGRHNGWFDVGIGDTLEVRLGASVSNIDAAQLAAFAGAPGSITGMFGASARLGGQGRDLRTALGSLRGAGEILVVNGSMRGLNLVETVVRFLGRAPRRETSTDGTPFERLAANFAMGDGLVRTDDLTIHSTDFDIFGKGTLRLDTEVLDGRAEVVLSPALSAQANPTVYRYARTGDRVVLPGTIAGTLAKPQVRFDAAAAVEQAIGNEIERRLSDLLDLVRRGR